MVGIAQLVEHRLVVPVVAGSSPVVHPGPCPRFLFRGQGIFHKSPDQTHFVSMVRNGDRGVRPGFETFPLVVRNGEGSNLSRFEIACQGGVRDSELACGRTQACAARDRGSGCLQLGWAQ